MSTVRSFRFVTGAAIAAFALAVPAAPAVADGLPLPVEDSPSGVLSPDGTSRYLTVTLGGRTALLAQRAHDGAMTGRSTMRGYYGIPLVAYDSTAGGIAHDGRTLVLIRPRTRFPRKTTTFAIFRTKPVLRLRQTVRLRGDFSYDALSPDGRSLYLINYLSATDPTKYRVRVFDLARNRLEPKPIVDAREAPDEMNGLPVTRVSSPDGRWAYTLYDGNGKHPFIHALDTRDAKAFCIDLKGPAFGTGVAFEMKLALAAGGARIDVLRKGAPVATVDTATFAVRTGAAAVAALDEAAPSGNPDGPSPMWAVLGVALLGAGFVVVWWRRRRSSSGREAVAAARRDGIEGSPDTTGAAGAEEFDVRVAQSVP
jgi:hypothetical protein